ncbi:MAG: hypothetical protein ONB24_05145 [candidate division KSB1 bacterium]|nr:hypothetical protein [candidate division KSB1 bacterium]
MEYTYEQLHKMKVTELREIAAKLDHPELQGYTQLNKEHLLPKLCHVLGIEAHAHHVAVGLDKTAIKREIRLAKQMRDEALREKDKEKLAKARKKIHELKGKLRRAIR